MVKVYSIPSCPWCKKAKTYLSSKGVDYVDINVEEDAEGRKRLLEISEGGSVPVLDINGNIVLGFDKEKIDEYLNF